MEAHEEIGQSNPSSAWPNSRGAFVVLIKGNRGRRCGCGWVLREELGSWGEGGGLLSSTGASRVIVATAAFSFLLDISAPGTVDQVWANYKAGLDLFYMA